MRQCRRSPSRALPSFEANTGQRMILPLCPSTCFNAMQYCCPYSPDTLYPEWSCAALGGFTTGGRSRHMCLDHLRESISNLYEEIEQGRSTQTLSPLTLIT